MEIKEGEIVRVYKPWYYSILRFQRPIKDDHVGRLCRDFSGRQFLIEATVNEPIFDEYFKIGVWSGVKVERLV